MADHLDELVHRADLDGLVRHVDDTCSARDWEHLLRIRNSARSAVETGRQLWPIATLANYRLALWAPADLAVRALDDTARTFMPGPVSEILAVHHTWTDLEPFLAPSHDRSLFAHERSLRGDDIDPAEPSLIDIPVALQDWEPRYAPASYDDDGVVTDAPLLPRPTEHLRSAAGEQVDDPETTMAFRTLLDPWTSQSNGSARCVTAEGGVHEALHALGVDECSAGRLDARTGLEVLAWAGASGGAHGRRRGLASGRSHAWWFLSVFTGLDEDWPCDPDELGGVISGLEWWQWSAPENGGWNVNLVIVDNAEGLACALHAHDRT